MSTRYFDEYYDDQDDEITFQEEDIFFEEDDFFEDEITFPQRGVVLPAKAYSDNRMAMIMAPVAAIIIILLIVIPQLRSRAEAGQTANVVLAPAGQTQTTSLQPTPSQLSPVFTSQVLRWEPHILAWSASHGVTDPNLTAIIMQIESCGDPTAISGAGAQGLFQVMPFHFEAGEDSLDPNTNAKRGLNYFVERLAQTNGDIGRAFAGYNGGHVAAGSSWSQWANETQRYYTWSTGIYNDIQAGLTQSPTVTEWLAAGGQSLCNQAEQTAIQ